MKLKVRQLKKTYDGKTVLDLEQAEIQGCKRTAIIGPNGAGKSTTVLSATGILKVAEGSVIELNGENIANMGPHKIVKRGVSLSPEGREVFPSLTVEENLRRTLVLSDGSFSIFLSHPIALVLLAIAAISLLSPIFLNLWKKRSTNKQSGN